jgi:hypothetical protein
MITAYQGSEVISIIKEDSFAAEWEILYNNCEWVTAFQSRLYVLLWYEFYQKKYTPLLLIEKSGNEVNGLFALAITDDNRVVGAGYPQAEYQTWISTNNKSDNFFIQCVNWIINNLPGYTIELKYLPKNTPIKNLLKDRFLQEHSICHEYLQPVMRIDEEFLNQELRKKNRKEKINRLNRLGVLKFERLTNYEEFIKIIDELIIQHDFRKGAMYGEEFFAQDQFKKDFILSLFKEGQLHVTLLWLNNEIIAANASIHGKGIVHLQGFNTHSPFYSKYSPGILRFLMLGLQMNKEGYSEFDLTPGGIDGYKTELATDFYKTHELIITSKSKRIKISIVDYLKDFIKSHWPENKRGLLKKGKIKEFKKSFLKKLRLIINKGPSEFFKIKNLMQEPTQDFGLIEVSKPEYFEIQTAKLKFGKNNLKDLLSFSDDESLLTRQKFLFDAMRKIEFGHQVYTLKENGLLQACVWYVPKDAKIENPKLSKSEYAYIYLSLHGKVPDNELEEFVSVSVNDIFQNHSNLNALFFKSYKGNKSIIKSLDLEKLQKEEVEA